MHRYHSHRGARLAFAFALAATGISAASAAEPTLAWTRSYAGAWTLSGVTEGAPYCELSLGAEGAIGGASIKVSATCRRNFPLEKVAAWTLRGDDVVLIDSLRKAVLAFSRTDGGFYAARLPSGEVVSLERGGPNRPKSRKELLDGTFTLSGPNNAAPCGFSVSAESANTGDLEQVGACPANWKARAWRRWSFARGHLNLLAADGSTLLSLTPADGFTFVAEMPDGPVFFGPGVIEADR